MTPVTILADVGERRSGIPGVLGELGADVTFDVLAAGDYLVGSATLVERKSVEDLQRYVITGFLWRHHDKLRARGPRSCSLFQAPRLDGRVSDHGIRGAVVSVLETGIPVVEWIAARFGALAPASCGPRRRAEFVDHTGTTSSRDTDARATSLRDKGNLAATGVIAAQPL